MRLLLLQLYRWLFTAIITLRDEISKSKDIRASYADEQFLKKHDLGSSVEEFETDTDFYRDLKASTWLVLCDYNSAYAKSTALIDDL